MGVSRDHNDPENKIKTDHGSCESTPRPGLLAEKAPYAGGQRREKASAEDVSDTIAHVLRSLHKQYSDNNCEQSSGAGECFLKWFVGFHICELTK
jgi:hypothetical protein